MNISRWVIGIVAGIGLSVSASAEPVFHGWEAMRVARQESAVSRATAVDVTGDGRQELLLVDPRQSRLLLFRWLDAERRNPAAPADPDRPNDLPMVSEVERLLIPLEELPREIAAVDLTGDGRQELLVLVNPPLKLVALRYNPDAAEPDQAFERLDSWSLEGGALGNRVRLLVHPAVDGRPPQAIISFENGIQLIDLKPDAKPRWLTPRERAGRLDLWLADLNGDGLLDLVEFTRTNERTIRWYENVQGNFAAPALLSDTAVSHAGLLRRPDHAAQVLLLTSLPAGQLRRFKLGEGEEAPFAMVRPLPVPVAGSNNWAAMNLTADRPVLLYIDSQQPRMVIHGWSEHGWGEEKSFPAVSDVQSVASPRGSDGLLLLHSKDARDIHQSRWDGTRMTFPRPWVFNEDVEDRRILTLSTDDQTVWWVQKVGDDLMLFVMDPGAEEPVTTRFTGAGNADSVRWLGGNRMLFQERFARSPKLAVIEDDQTRITEPTQLANVPMAEWLLMGAGEERKLGRLVDGVLQWVGDDLQPMDQVMLGEGARLRSLVMLENGQGLALQQGGTRLVRLEADDADILREVERFILPGGERLVRDPRLGLLLVGNESVTRLDDGRPRELSLLQSLDVRNERTRRLDETTPARIFVTDVTGDGRDDVVLFDDEQIGRAHV